MKHIRLAFLLLLSAIFVIGCGAIPKQNLLKGWKVEQRATLGCPFDKTICDDYEAYIQRLSPKERAAISEVDILFYSNGTTLRAVEITIPINNRTWVHVLFFDGNRRTRVKKYVSGWYVS